MSLALAQASSSGAPTKNLAKLVERVTFHTEDNDFCVLRLTESTGTEAKTIHRLLETDPKNGGFKRDEMNPLGCDFLVSRALQRVPDPRGGGAIVSGMLRGLSDDQ